MRTEIHKPRCEAAQDLKGCEDRRPEVSPPTQPLDEIHTKIQQLCEQLEAKKLLIKQQEQEIDAKERLATAIIHRASDEIQQLRSQRDLLREHLVLAQQMVAIESKRANEAESALAKAQADRRAIDRCRREQLASQKK